MTSTIDAPLIDAPTKSTRYFELDTLRGLAAMLVVLYHLLGLWLSEMPSASWMSSSIWALVAPVGGEAVMLFFVLSGFVLSLPAINGRPQTYFTFLIRRVFRIYIPYLAALFVSVAGAFWLHGIVTRGNWFYPFWPEPLSWRLVWQHILFIGVYNSQRFDPPIWSLVHEMRISLVFPLMCWFVLRLKSKWSFVIAGGLTITAIMIYKLPFQFGPSVGDSLQYSGLFVLGIFLARERSTLGAWLSHRRRITKALAGAAFLWLYLFAGPPLIRHNGHFPHHSMLCISQWITALGAGGLMIVSMYSASCKLILAWRPIHFLGQISYSLYLWHFIVLMFCVRLLYGRMPLWIIICLALVLSIAVSWCSYLWIEKPSMNLGRRLSNSFQRHPVGLSA